MNAQVRSSITSSSAQANSPFVRSSNGNGQDRNSDNGNRKHAPLVHLRRCRHRTACGKDFLYFDGVLSTTKVVDTTCKGCRRVHIAGIALRRKARLWEKALGCIKQPARLKPGGPAQLKTAFQEAIAQAAQASMPE